MILFKKTIFYWLLRLQLLITLIFLTNLVHAQITVNYPAPAEQLTRGLSQGKLTVTLAFTTACSGNSVTVSLPSSVNYIAGSVVKTGGTLAASGITENNISNLNAPVFTLNGITGAGDITFTIMREAGCGVQPNGKDSITVSGSCGMVTENDPFTNAYNILSPALALVSPAPVTNAFAGTTATRTVTITNGGNGCLDTLRYYVVYTGGGIVNTNAGNSIIANGVTFTPFFTSGDTLFYKIYGPVLFGGDNLLCNGETVNIIENIKAVTCNPSTSYAASWGKLQDTPCQSTVGSGTVAMAAGASNLGITFNVTESATSGACDGSTIRVTYTNNGTGGNAGAAYDIAALLGNVAINTPIYRLGFTADDPRLNGTGSILAYSYTGGDYPNIVSMSQFTSDPDGAGTGLEDLDGDGQFDDLAPGQSFSIVYTRKEIVAPNQCPRSFYASVASQVNYSPMCREAGTMLTNIIPAGYGHVFSTSAVSKVAPPSIYPGTTFTARICVSGTYVPQGPNKTDSLELFITLPPGVTYVGNALYSETITPDFVAQTGQLLTVRQKWLGNASSTGFCFSFQLSYDCSSGPTLTVPFSIQYVADRDCNAIDQIVCADNLAINAHCSLPCPSGAANFPAIAQRTNYGWTDWTLSAKVNPASLPALSRKSVTVFDTLNITQGASQHGTYNNLYYYLQENRVGGADVFQYIGGTFHFKAGGTGIEQICVLPAPDASASTYALTILQFNLSSLLGGGCGLPAALNSADTFWVDINYRITDANNGLLYGGTLQTPASGVSYFYNLDGANTQLFCDQASPEVYVMGLGRDGAFDYSHPRPIAGCTSTDYSLQDYRLYSFETIDAFPNEYRPIQYVDSVVVTLPAGVYLDPAVATYVGYQNFNGLFGGGGGLNSVTPVVAGSKISFINPGNWLTSDIAPPNFFNNARLYYSLLPSCSINPAHTDISVTYYVHDYYYSGLQPQKISTTTRVNALDYSSITKPSISIQNNTGAVQGILQQHYWDVQINNNSTVTAPYLWIALEKNSGSGGISIDSVVLKPSNSILTVAGNYNSTDKWYKINTAGLASGIAQQVRIYFKYSSCTADSILVRAGWNCTGYPSPDPSTGYACIASQTYLKVIPESSQAQLQIDRQPGNGSTVSLCSADSILLVVNSALSGNLLNPYVNVYPPAGVTIQTPVKIEYPLGSGNYQDALVTAISGGYKLDLTAHSAIGSSGLPGTVLNPGIAGRQAKLQINYSTSCGISSGSPLSFALYGNQPCGTAAIGSGSMVQTAGVTVTGAVATGTAGINLGVSVSSLHCGSTTTVNLSTTPVTSPSQTGDTVIYTIPAGLKYNGNFTGGVNCGSCSVITEPGAIAGSSFVKVALQPGVAAGSALNYSFDITADASVCGSVVISASMKRDILPLMCGATACSSGSAIIGLGSSPAITINKPVLVTNAFNFTDTRGANPQTVTYSFDVSNTGLADAPAGVYLAKIFCGINGSGNMLSAFYINAVNAGTTIKQTGSFTYNNPADCFYSGALFVEIQDTTATGEKNCLCSTSTGSLAAQVLPVQLTSFTATENNCITAVNWATAEETSGVYFELQSSSNGIVFNTIQHTTGKGTNSIYHYADAGAPPGNTYYRLLLVGKDGSNVYSKIITVTNSCTGKINITASPNPVKNTVTVTGLSHPATINILDMPGRLLATMYATTNVQKIDMHGFAAATYLLQIIQDGKLIKSIKMIKE